MDQPRRQSLERALRDAAQALEEALGATRAAHRQYGRLADSDRTWSRLEATLTDEVRRRRIDVAASAATPLVALLRAEADAAATRYPDVDTHGEPLPSRPQSDDPVVVRDWWAALDGGDRELVLEREAAWVGGADGLPVAVRHDANVRLLHAELARRDTQGAALAEEPRDAVTVEEERDLRGLRKLADFLTDGEDDETRHLYLLDATAYPLKAAVVLGDVEGADVVILHVPGATTSVDLRLARELSWLRALRREAQRLAPSARVAAVDWIGYHAPYDIATRRALGDSGVTVLVPGEASDDRYAREAAPALAACADGLRALAPRPARLVASGHSYGASVWGLALAATDACDAAVVAGAPGLFTSTTDGLRLPPDSLYAAIAPGDLIAFLGVFGGQVASIAGVQLLSPFPRRASYPDGARVLLRQVWGHESYYAGGGATLHEMAAAAVGAPDVRTISRRGFLAALGRGESTGRRASGSSLKT